MPTNAYFEGTAITNLPPSLFCLAIFLVLGCAVSQRDLRDAAARLHRHHFLVEIECDWVRTDRLQKAL